MKTQDLVLIDTCIWVPFFNRPQSQLKRALDKLLDEDRAALIGPILAEILHGFRGDEEAESPADAVAVGDASHRAVCAAPIPGHPRLSSWVFGQRILVPEDAQTAAPAGDRLALFAGQHVEVPVAVEVQQLDKVELDPPRPADLVRRPDLLRG